MTDQPRKPLRLGVVGYPRPTPERAAALQAAIAKAPLDSAGPGVLYAVTANA